MRTSFASRCQRACSLLVFIVSTVRVQADVVHSYDAQDDVQTPDAFRDLVGGRHWSLAGCLLEREIQSAGTILRSAYRLDRTGTGVGGDTTPFDAGDTSFELWIRPGALDAAHQVIFETGGGQNGSSFHITESTIRFLNSRLNTRNSDLSVPIDDVDTSDFIHVVASLDQTARRIDLYVRGASGERLTAGSDGPVGRGGNRASLFSWGSGLGRLGGNHNNLGGRTEIANTSPVGLTQFRGEIALLRVHDVALSAAEVEAAFDEVAGASVAIESFTATPDDIASGEEATLSWSVSNATTVSIEPGIGAVGASGSVVVSPNLSTVYTLTASDGRIARTASVQVTVDGAPLPLSLTEFLADNDNTLEDGDGRSSDWVEIHNPNVFAIDLEGYFLTDTLANLQLWQFSSLEIDAEEYLVVFLSDRVPSEETGIIDAAGFPHAGLQLSSNGEYLALVAPDGQTVLSEFAPTYPEQHEDVSYGVDPSRGSRHAYFPVPTPGEPNDASVTGFVEDTMFSVDRGLFDAPFSVEIESVTPGATIRYTLDGSAPTADSAEGADDGNGELYTGPIEITTTTTLRAIAYLDDHAPTNVDTQTYIFLERVVEQPNDPEGFPRTWAGIVADYEMDPDVVGPNNVFDDVYRDSIIDDLASLPVLSIVMDQTDLFGATGIYENPQGDGVAWERPASFELFYPDGTRRDIQQNCAIRIQGGSSRSTNYPKHSFRLLFKRDYGPGKLRYPLFADQPEGDSATDTFDTIVLRAHFNNSWTHWHWFQNPRALYVRDLWTRDSQLAMGSPSSHGLQVHLYLNGLYWGIYNPSERPTAPFMAEYYGGEREDYDTQNVNAAREGDLVAWNRMMQIANGGVTSQAAYDRIREYCDVVNLADYMMLNFYVGNDDWDGHNWYAGRRREEGAGYQFFCWDSELIISRHAFPPPQPDFDVILNRDRVGLNVNNKPSRLFTQLRQNAEFRLLFADRVRKHFDNDGALTTENSLERLRVRVDQVWRAVVAESARWGDYRRDVRQHADYTPDQYDLFHRDVHYVAQLDWITNTYFPQRRDIVLDQFRRRGLLSTVAAPDFSPHGAEIPLGESVRLSISPHAGTIYYTTDGSDPRLEGGAVSPSAETYAEPIDLTTSTIVKARARSGETWSALTESLYAVDTGLRVTEIQYHPAPEDVPEGQVPSYDSEEYAFIELQNTSDEVIDLRGVRFDGGVRFEFAGSGVEELQPGEFVVVVENLFAFAERYDLAAILVAGQFRGQLDNDGETVHLVGALDETIQEFTYSDDWYPSTDGQGPSLVIRDATLPRSDWNLAESWQPSSAPLGTPGIDESRIEEGGFQLPSDLGQDGRIDLSDAVVLLRHLFVGTPAELPCGDGTASHPSNALLFDANADDQLNLTDAIHVLAYLFQGGASPAGGTECVRVVECEDRCEP